MAASRCGGAYHGVAMARQKDHELEPTIGNRRALHDYFIEGKLECGIALMGSEVKSIRMGKAQLSDAFAKVEGRKLVLHNCHIDPYEKAAGYTHLPKRPRVLLVHRREMKRLAKATEEASTTLVPLSMYFKEGLVKVELGVARNKKQHDKRASIKKRELDQEVRRATTQRRR